jgi:PAS domain S-box-containing protein
MKKINILLVYDENTEATKLKNILESLGYRVPYIAPNYDEALIKAMELKPDLILADNLSKYDINGFDLAFKTQKIDIPVIFLTTLSGKSDSDNDEHINGYNYLIKPVDPVSLGYSVELALYKHGMNKKLKQSQDCYREMFHHMSSGAVIYEAVENGKNFIIKDINRKSEIIDKINRKAVVDKLVTDVFPKVNDFGLMEILKRVYETGVPEEHQLSHYEDTRISGWRENYVYKLPTNEIVAVYDDMTEYKEMKQKIITSEEKYRHIIETTHEGVSISDNNELVEYVNQRILDMLGYEKYELIGHNIFEFIDEDDVPLILEYREKLAKGEKFEFTGRFLKKDGSKLVTITQSSPIYDSKGFHIANLSMHTDVTERFNTNKGKHQKLEDKYKFMFESMLIGVVYHDQNGHITSLNPAAGKILGISLDEARLRSFYDYRWKSIHLDGSDYPGEDHPSMVALKTGKKIKNQIMGIYNPKKKKYQWININATPHFRDGENKPYQVYTTFEDITERTEINYELEKSENKYKNLFENMPGIVHYWKVNYGNNGQIIDWTLEDANPAGLKSWNTKIDDVKFKHSDEIIPGSVEHYRPIIEKVMKEKKSYTFEDYFEPLNQYMLYSVFPVGNDFFIAAGADITEIKNSEIELKRSLFREKTLGDIIRNTSVAIGIAYPDGTIGMVNKEFEQLTGYSREELQSINWSVDLTPAKWKIKEKNQLDKILKTKKPVSYEKEYIKKDGSVIPIELIVHPSYNSAGHLDYFFGFITDITDRKKAQIKLENAKDELEEKVKQRTKELSVINTKLQMSQQRYKNLADLLPVMVIETDEKCRIKFANKAFFKITGYSETDIIKGLDICQLLVEEDRRRVLNNISRSSKQSETDIEYTALKKDGNKLPVISYSSKIMADDQFKGLRCVILDFTNLREAREHLKSALKEKETLLKEIHHRVKNNLIIISSLLNLQARYVKNEEDFDMFLETQTRANSMALIHEKLYNAKDLKLIDISDYTKKLARDLFTTYSIDLKQIDLIIDIECIKLDIDITLPLGLIINELLTNCLKYAFPNGRKGVIHLEMRSIDDSYVLSIEDNGVGFPTSIDYKNTDSLGMQLVNSLVDQIDGEITLDTAKGTEFKIVFKKLKF